MKIRKLLGAGVSVLTATVTANRLLAMRAGDLDRPLPGTDETYHWRGFDISYTEAGDPDNPDVLLIHGVSAAASSREFVEIFEKLSKEYHVIAPDLPGFGRSDRPPLLYSASLYESFVTDAIEQLAEDPHVIASSLSGAYTARGASESTVKSLLLILPTDSTVDGSPRSGVRTLVRAPLVGTALFNLVTSKPAIRHFYRAHAVVEPTKHSAETLAYAWESAHQPGARYAPASFLSGHLDPDTDLADALADFDQVTLVWGREADITPLSSGRALAEKTDGRLVVFDDAKLLPHVEHPDSFVEVATEAFESTEE